MKGNAFILNIQITVPEIARKSNYSTSISKFFTLPHVY